MSEDFYSIFVSLFFVSVCLVIPGCIKGITKGSVGHKYRTLWQVLFYINIPILLFVSGSLFFGLLLDGIGIGNPMR